MSISGLSDSAKRFFLVYHRIYRPSCIYQSAAFGISHGHHPHGRYSSFSYRRSQATAAVKRAESISSVPFYYNLFPKTIPAGPPPKGTFSIDLSQLRREFLQLQARVHPDKFPTGPDKAKAEGTSASINEAYKTLQNPLLRAQYLLGLRGIYVADDETAKTEDPDLLMTVMDVREQVEAAEQEADIHGLKLDNDRRIQDEEAVLTEVMEKDDMNAAKEAAVRLRYWVNIQGALNDWEPGKPLIMHH